MSFYWENEGGLPLFDRTTCGQRIRQQSHSPFTVQGRYPLEQQTSDAATEEEEEEE